MANWMDFSMSPLRAAREMHVSPRDVARGAQVDAVERARRAYMKENARLRSAEDASAMRRSQNEAPRMYAGELKQAPRSDLISNALLAGNLGGLSAAFGALAPLRAGLAVGAGSDAVLSAGNGGELPAGLAAAGVLGRRALPAALASGAAYAADAEASPLSGLMKFLRSSVEPSYVVKPKGGNWINNSVEDALRGLKRNIPFSEAEQQAMANANGMSVERFYAQPQNKTVPLAKAWREANPPQDPINNWIEGPLTKYVKNRMASPDDEVRRLAEEGVLHFDPRVDNAMRRSASAQAHRKIADGLVRTPGLESPGAELATSPMAKRWEDLTDSTVLPGTYAEHVPLESLINERISDSPNILKRIGGDYAAANPDATAYAMNRGRSTQDLGFSHLIDELSNALNPNSGLPAHLQLSPDAVKNMSMEKAVRRVADINEWRAAQKVEANRALAEKASIVREYPHSDAAPNPKGLRWVELRQNLPEKPTGDITDEKLLPWEEAKRRTAKELEDQLKYEGDTMGHCVGGYCDDVLSGRSRIFSLRDAKGEPHVTVEIDPTPNSGGVSGDWADSIRPGLWDEYLEQQKNVETGIDGLYKYIKTKYPELLEQANRPSIVQIKGKQNRKPNDEYLPFVQDFVKNPPHGSPWGDVGDLQNTGLRSMGELEVAGVSPVKLKNLQQKYGRTYFSIGELEQEVPRIRDLLGGKYASGGTVKQNPPAVDIQAIMAALKEHHAHA